MRVVDRGAIIEFCVLERLKRLALDMDNCVIGVVGVGVKQAKRGDRRRGKVLLLLLNCDPPRIGVEHLSSITTVEFTLISFLALNCIFKKKEENKILIHIQIKCKQIKEENIKRNQG